LKIHRTSAFVDLDRRFRALEPGERPEESAYSSYIASLIAPGLSWKDILKHRLVVVLGEAGSGKTWEFRERARVLTAEGHRAFYVQLDRLVLEPLDQIVGSEDVRRLRAWLRGNEQATFLLDSVDEAKFRKVSDFLTALDRFAVAVQGASLRRLRLLVSSRISEWRPYGDARELLDRFPPPPEERRQGRGTTVSEDHPDDQPLLVVQLEALDNARVERLARDIGVADPEAFLRALDDRHAWEFARRPIDVVDLVSYWSEHHRLGSLTELLEYDLNRKLRETDTRTPQDPLCESRARDGAQALAAATIFCRRFSFCVRDDADPSKEDALDACGCLPSDWKPAECRALLMRPLFDSAAFGRIRFHHRRLAEYLAARWLNKRMQEGCPINVIEDLLFNRIGSRRVVRPALAPVAAWLSTGDTAWNKEVQRWALEAAPWIYLQYGDPEALSADFKRKVVSAFVAHFHDRRQVWVNVDGESLQRLADPVLSDDVSAIIRDRDISVDLRSAMLQLVRHGRLTGCMDTALDIVATPDEDDHLKIYAAAAIRDLADTAHRRCLAEVANRLPAMSDSLCALICETVFPDAVDAAGLVALMRKADWVQIHGSDLPVHLKHRFEEVLKVGVASGLLEELVGLAETPPGIIEGDKPTPLSSQFAWVGELIPTVLVKLLERQSLTSDEADTAARALWLLGYLLRSSVPTIELPGNLNALTTPHPTVRQRWFWRLVEDRRKDHEHDPSYSWFLFGRGVVLQPEAVDLEWLVHDISSRETEKDRQLVLRLATDIWCSSGRPYQVRRRIHQAVAGDAELAQSFRDRMADFSWHRRLAYRVRGFREKLTNRWAWQRRFHGLRFWWQYLREQWILLRHFRTLASGKPTVWLAHLAHDACGANDGHRWTPSDWSALRKKRGRLVAWAAKSGCKRAWRKFVPLLPHEKPVPNETDTRVVVGLAGLHAEYEDGELDFRQLDEDEAQLATRYAVNELNGFPEWFGDLARQQRKAVREVLGTCIRGEWQFPADRQNAHEVIADLTWQGQGLIPLVRDTLLDQLRGGDPPNAVILDFALQVLATSYSEAFPELARLAAVRIKAQPLDNEVSVLWLVVWMQLDAGTAMQFVHECEAAELDRRKMIERLCSTLGSRRPGQLPLMSHPDYLAPNHLRRFIPLVYQYVRPADDIDRLGKGAYSPTTRDEAQSFRDGLLDRLAQIESSNAAQALLELASEPILAPHRDWILHLLDKRAEQQSDLPPWEEEDVRVFSQEHETEPKTDCELFKIACRRLTDIKHEVEKSDNSLRDELHPDDLERPLRRWFARKLQERSRRRYTVPQEEEIDQEQKPDIRIENPRTAPVPIEVKWANRWSLSELLERLENQLVGQYMRAHDVRFGIYLIGTIGDKRHWGDPPDQPRVEFPALLRLLQARADEIVSSQSDIENIAVVGIDFRNP